MTPRFLARASNFLIEASLRSMSGASPLSAISASEVSCFAILTNHITVAAAQSVGKFVKVCLPRVEGRTFSVESQIFIHSHLAVSASIQTIQFLKKFLLFVQELNQSTQGPNRQCRLRVPREAKIGLDIKSRLRFEIAA